MDGQGNTVTIRDLPLSVPHCVSAAETSTSGQGRVAQEIWGAAQDRVILLPPTDTPRPGPGLWQVGSGGKLASSSQPRTPPQRAGLLSAWLLGYRDKTSAGLLGASPEAGSPISPMRRSEADGCPAPLAREPRGRTCCSGALTRAHAHKPWKLPKASRRHAPLCKEGRGTHWGGPAPVPRVPGGPAGDSFGWAGGVGPCKGAELPGQAVAGVTHGHRQPLHFRAWGSAARGAPTPTPLLPQTPQ